MATGLDLKVSVEKAIHGALRDAIQAISDQHGIQLTSVNVEWLDLSRQEAPQFKVSELRVSTFSRAV